MLDVIERCLPELVTGTHLETLQTLIPGYGQSLQEDTVLLENVRQYTSNTLGLWPAPSELTPERSISA